ncbi:MAG TPA: hypothetical protein VN451_02945 [Chitinophagaceae bacterium]|nr:hypothetical protein [Chitinophagaceae bacterium]
MKKIILFMMLLVISAASFSQQTNSLPTLTKQDYLKKSSNKKFAAWVLLGGGTAVLAITALSNLGLDFGGPKKSFPSVPVGIGAVCMAGSIPFFIASAKNKRKATSLSFKNELAPQIQKSSFVYQSVPSLSLKISL